MPRRKQDAQACTCSSGGCWWPHWWQLLARGQSARTGSHALQEGHARGWAASMWCQGPAMLEVKVGCMGATWAVARRPAGPEAGAGVGGDHQAGRVRHAPRHPGAAQQPGRLVGGRSVCSAAPRKGFCGCCLFRLQVLAVSVGWVLALWHKPATGIGKQDAMCKFTLQQCGHETVLLDLTAIPRVCWATPAVLNARVPHQRTHASIEQPRLLAGMQRHYAGEDAECEVPFAVKWICAAGGAGAAHVPLLCGRDADGAAGAVGCAGGAGIRHALELRSVPHPAGCACSRQDPAGTG